MIVHVNGRRVEVAEHTTVGAVVAGLDTEGRGARGVAVAVDSEVVPRGEWERRELSDGARVEVVAAVQGG